MILYATSSEGLGYDITNTIVIGRSIGTGVAVEMATRFPALKGLVLISSFSSIREVAQGIAGSVSKYFVPDAFRNYELIKQIKCPTLFIHGKRDELIPYTHSTKLHSNATCRKKLVICEEMDHLCCDIESAIYEPIESFLLRDVETKNSECLGSSEIKNIKIEVPNILRKTGLVTEVQQEKISKQMADTNNTSNENSSEEESCTSTMNDLAFSDIVRPRSYNVCGHDSWEREILRRSLTERPRKYAVIEIKPVRTNEYYEKRKISKEEWQI